MALSSLMTPSSHAYIPKTSSPTFRRTVRCSAAVPVSTNFDLRNYWTSLMKEVDQKLTEALPLKYPELIHESMRYSVLAKAARRGPPAMCVAACELFGGDRATAFPTACALEMVHAASLIHDDLPYMDDAESRRGQPTNHTVYGEDMAVLAGDALFPLGFRHIVLNTPPDVVPQARLLQVITEIARAVGSTGMAAGQFLDIEGRPNAIEFVQEKKFGELSQCSAVCGGLLGGASDDEIQRLRKYGRAVGVLYQVVEDIMEARTETGKDGNCKKKGKSYVSVYGVEKALEVAEDLKSVAKKELDGFEKYGEKVLALHSFIDFATERGFSIRE
uniref:Putative geranyl diphosphate synthase small subunit type II.B n=1 Tax=Leucosceptrum canum TaxID=694369 RepID=A0A0U3BX49_LEUCN|nr:putative geranyl diphosphate synthase small subunit type II.B [Leucosceptrum canum]